jgi:hypothetical protein
MPNSIFLFPVDAHPSDIGPRAVIQHHCRRAAALLRHRSGAEHRRHLVYHLSGLRAAILLSQESNDPAAVFQLATALSRLTAASRSPPRQAAAALHLPAFIKVDTSNLVDAVRDVGKTLAFLFHTC